METSGATADLRGRGKHNYGKQHDNVTLIMENKLMIEQTSPKVDMFVVFSEQLRKNVLFFYHSVGDCNSD